MYTVRKVLAMVLMIVASFFKILMVVVAPADLKQEFEDNV